MEMGLEFLIYNNMKFHIPCSSATLSWAVFKFSTYFPK
jgi:hypothetical protein